MKLIWGQGSAAHHPRPGIQNRRGHTLLVVGAALLAVVWRFGVFLEHSGPNIFASDENVQKGSKYAMDENLRCPRLNVTSNLFRPLPFFEQGSGKAFRKHALRTQDELSLTSRFLWFPEPPKSLGSCPFVFYHIHKNGGGSMGKHVSIQMDKFNSESERQMGRENYTTASQKYLKQAYESRKHGGDQPMVIFTFIRDPLERFLSSLGQVLKGPTGLLRKHLSPCHNSMTTADLIDCVLNKMEETSSFLDEHFAPQSYELYSGVQGFDLAIAVVDLSLLSEVVTQLGGSQSHVHENSAVGVVYEYPQFLLAPSSLTRDFQRRICRLYEADVRMLAQTQVTTTECSELQSR
jgi:hypothetical protein